jgi:pimeloyl-ACP methyl ester carboxylesterase
MDGALDFVEAGRGTAVLLLHGFALDHRLWSGQLASFSVRHRVVAPTLPDFGPRPRRVAMTTARAVVDLMDSLGIGEAHVVGLSLGGAVAVDMALAFARRVRSITLVDALLRGRPTGLGEYAVAAEHARAGRLDEARRAWLGGALFAPTLARDDVRDRVLEMVADYDGAHWAGQASTAFEIAEHEPRLQEISCPALVVVGELDTAPFRAMTDAYTAAIPGARRVVLPRCGHLANLEAAPAFDELVLSFFDNESA